MQVFFNIKGKVLTVIESIDSEENKKRDKL